MRLSTVFWNLSSRNLPEKIWAQMPVRLEAEGSS
jgi:hypothetical protein